MSENDAPQSIEALREAVLTQQARVELLIEQTPYQNRWGTNPENPLNREVRKLDELRCDLYEAEHPGRKAAR